MPNDRKNQDQDRRSTESRSEKESLERREYRGPHGEIHHHTRTYMKQHGGSNDKGDRGGKDKSR